MCCAHLLTWQSVNVLQEAESVHQLQPVFHQLWLCNGVVSLDPRFHFSLICTTRTSLAYSVLQSLKLKQLDGNYLQDCSVSSVRKFCVSSLPDVPGLHGECLWLGRCVKIQEKQDSIWKKKVTASVSPPAPGLPPAFLTVLSQSLMPLFSAHTKDVAALGASILVLFLFLL